MAIKSPLASCLVGSKLLTVCGKVLDNLRKEKKHSKYNGRKISGYGNFLQWRSMASKVEMSICDLTDGQKGA